MKIRSALIQNFGKLKNQSFEFSDGLNVITGKNESGKSSFARLIRSILSIPANNIGSITLSKAVK